MTKGTLLAALFLAAYLGFEAYAIRKVSHRTEPAYIHNLMLEAQAAVQLCQFEVQPLETRFAKTLERVDLNYQRDIEEDNPDLSATAIVQQLAQQSTEAKHRVSESINTTGCDSAEAKAHLQRYRIYARRTR